MHKHAHDYTAPVDVMANSLELRVFSGADYAVFACTLLISSGIGVYHALTGGRQRTTSEFLLADRNMNPIPVAISLVASFISAITFLGTPAENYIYGCMFWLYGLAYILTGLFTWRGFMPVFFRLKVTSAFEVRLPCVVTFASASAQPTN